MKSEILKQRAVQLHSYAEKKLEERFGDITQADLFTRAISTAVLSIADYFPQYINEDHIDNLVAYNFERFKMENPNFNAGHNRQDKEIYYPENTYPENDWHMTDGGMVHALIHELLHAASPAEVEWRDFNLFNKYDYDGNLVWDYIFKPRDEKSERLSKALNQAKDNHLNLIPEMGNGFITWLEGGFVVDFKLFDGEVLLSNDDPKYVPYCFPNEGMIEKLACEVVKSPDCRQNAQYYNINMQVPSFFGGGYALEVGMMTMLDLLYNHEFEKQIFYGSKYSKMSEILSNDNLLDFLYNCNIWTSKYQGIVKQTDATDARRNKFLDNFADQTRIIIDMLDEIEMTKADIYRVRQCLSWMNSNCGQYPKINQLHKDFSNSHKFQDPVEDLLKSKKLDKDFLSKNYPDKALDAIFASDLDLDDELVNEHINTLIRQKQDNERISGWMNYTKNQINEQGAQMPDYFEFLLMARQNALDNKDTIVANLIVNKYNADMQKCIDNTFIQSAHKIDIGEYNVNKLQSNWNVLTQIKNIAKNCEIKSIRDVVIKDIDDNRNNLKKLNELFIADKDLWQVLVQKAKSKKINLDNAIVDYCKDVESAGADPLTRKNLDTLRNGASAIQFASYAVLNKRNLINQSQRQGGGE